MAAKIVWSPQAIEDVNEICRYIAKDSALYALILAQSIVSAVEDVALFPYLGRTVPEKRNEKIREKIVGKYRVIYKIRNGTVQLLTVIHGARMLKL